MRPCPDDEAGDSPASPSAQLLTAGEDGSDDRRAAHMLPLRPTAGFARERGCEPEQGHAAPARRLRRHPCVATTRSQPGHTPARTHAATIGPRPQPPRTGDPLGHRRRQDQLSDRPLPIPERKDSEEQGERHLRQARRGDAHTGGGGDLETWGAWERVRSVSAITL